MHLPTPGQQAAFPMTRLQLRCWWHVFSKGPRIKETCDLFLDSQFASGMLPCGNLELCRGPDLIKAL